MNWVWWRGRFWKLSTSVCSIKYRTFILFLSLHFFYVCFFYYLHLKLCLTLHPIKTLFKLLNTHLCVFITISFNAALSGTDFYSNYVNGFGPKFPKVFYIKPRLWLRILLHHCFERLKPVLKIPTELNIANSRVIGRLTPLEWSSSTHHVCLSEARESYFYC